MSSFSSSRQRLGVWIESAPIQRLIIGLIIFNAITLGLETSATVTDAIGPLLRLADGLVLTVFVLEIAIKLFAFGGRFFRNPWYVFDFIVVGIALVPAGGPLAVLRALRVLRVLRLVSTVPQLRFIVDALLKAIPGISSIAGLMLLLFYVFAVMATNLYGERFPEWFGSIGASMYTLFQIMTMESWSMGIVRPVMEAYPLAWLFFIPFILIATFTMLNLFIGIIVDTMQTMHEAEHLHEREAFEVSMHADTDRVLEELSALRRELADLRANLPSGAQ
ncbi:ion transporter [Halochromatium roseum]|uniref:ion transporter n=1 Tax=Halochromatium roseum TaxID=391920 RepID=UPI001912A245|nr:ion transporter [Halochromatium roseum]MBK5941975.1 voltage-gated sodium channel [Halochromatium roseum]